MKKIISILSLLFVVFFFSSCSNDDTLDTNNTVVGEWKLTTWSIDVPINLNDDDIFSYNLLDEINCSNNETFVFENNGQVSNNDTFNAKIDIKKIEETNRYDFSIECGEGYVSYATTYTQNSNIVDFQDIESVISGNTLTRVFENAIEIYNEDFTEVIETKNLTLIYTKQ